MRVACRAPAASPHGWRASAGPSRTAGPVSSKRKRPPSSDTHKAPALVRAPFLFCGFAARCGSSLSVPRMRAAAPAGQSRDCDPKDRLTTGNLPITRGVCYWIEYDG